MLFHPELFRQPSDHALALVLKLHTRRPADFTPVSRVTNLAEGGDFRADTSAKTKLWRDLTMAFGNSEGRNKKSSDFTVWAEEFLHSVRILMFSYALVSSLDSDASLWLDMQSDCVHTVKVGKIVRMDSKTGVLCFLRLGNQKLNAGTNGRKLSRPTQT